MSDEWIQTTLGEVAAVNPKESALPEDAPFITMADVSEWGVWAEASGPRGTRAGTRARAGDTLMARITPCLENGKIAMVPSHLERVGGSTEFIVLRAGDALLPEFLFHWTCSFQTHHAAVGTMTGTTGRQRVSGSDLVSLPILVPPLPVQRRIVDLMTHLDAHIANLRAETAALGVALRTYRMVTFTHIKDQWPMVKLGDIVESLDSLRRPVKSADRVPGPYPYYGASGVVDFVDDWIFEGQSLLVSEDGANLRARSSPIAFCADGRYWVNNHAHVLRALGSTTNEFLAHYLESADIDLALTGTTMPKLNAANLLRIEVPQPPLAIQQEVTETLERLAVTVTASENELQRVGELRTALLRGLLVGAVDIPSAYDLLVEEAA